MEHNLLSGSTMLTQFSTMVANTQQYIQAAGTSPQYIQHVGDSPQLILPSVHEVRSFISLSIVATLLILNFLMH